MKLYVFMYMPMAKYGIESKLHETNYVSAKPVPKVALVMGPAHSGDAVACKPMLVLT
jgi:hypothetical protein